MFIQTTPKTKYKMQYRVIVGIFCQAYCEVMPISTYSKLGKIIDLIPEWVINLGFDNPTNDDPILESSTSFVVEGILRAFEASSIYRELWKVGIGFIQLASMNQLMTSRLDKHYNSTVFRTDSQS